jgi:hypothetical protein
MTEENTAHGRPREDVERACRFCGCTEARACVTLDQHADGMACWWLTEDVCSNPVCDAALNEDLANRVTALMLPRMVKQLIGKDQADAEAVGMDIVKLIARVVGGHLLA